MKYVYKGLLLFVILFGIVGCGNKNMDNKVILGINEDSLTNEGVTLILKNNSLMDYSYGETYYIEKYIDNNWKMLDTIHELVFNLPALGLLAGETKEININWEYGYGLLDSGKYRIVKEIFKMSDSNIDNSVKFNVYAEFEIDEENYVYEKAVIENVELKKEITAMNHGDNDDELVKYKVYIKKEKLYAKNLNTNEEKIVFDKEPIKNIAVRKLCCTGNGYLLILTTNGDVYISERDCNYDFSFDFPFKKLDVKDVVSFKLVPVADYDFVKNLYGIDSEGNEFLLHMMN